MLPFRYNLAPRARINFFEPKALDQGTDLLACRYSQLGAACLGSLHRLACAPTALCQVVWEAGEFIMIQLQTLNAMNDCAVNDLYFFMFF